MNSYELFEPNPNIHTDFPFLLLECNDVNCTPKRLHFQQLHWHEDLQITYVIHGSIKYQTLNQSMELSKGDAVFMNTKVLHQIIQLGEVEYKTLLFPRSMISFINNSKMDQELYHMTEENSLELYSIQEKNILDLIGQLDDLLTNKDEYYEYGVTSYLSMIMYELLKVMPYRKGSSNNNSMIQQCVAYIHEHYNENISLEDIASYSNISAGYCGKLFKTILNTSPYEYLIDYRIKKSLELMSDHSLSITQIAMNVGFNDVSNYVQSFKKRLNITPKQYMKQL